MDTLICYVGSVTKRASEVETSLDFMNEKYEKGRKDSKSMESEMEDLRQITEN